MKICIDPGHGMANRKPGVFDPGATHTENGHLFREADIALKYGLALKDALRARGVNVFMTRDDDTDVAPVTKRAAMAKDAGCTAYLSLHLNDVESDQANGTETLFRGTKDLELANAVQETAIGVLGTKDRGIKERTDLAVLKFDGPAALLELGFIGNDDDRNRLLSPQVRQALCESLADMLTGAPLVMADESDGIDQDEMDLAADGAVPYDTRATVLAATAMASPAAFATAFGGPAPKAAFDWAGFTARVQGWGLQHFAATELLVLGGSHAGGGACGGKNSLPPPDLWDRMEQTARFADAIRAALGHPIRVLSGYRNAVYNACVGGKPSSLHRVFNALDLRPGGGSLKRMLQIAQDLRASDPRFTGGIGYYPGSDFIHIDTRGQRADWVG